MPLKLASPKITPKNQQKGNHDMSGIITIGETDGMAGMLSLQSSARGEEYK